MGVCENGCCANQLCGWLVASLNAAACIAYIIALIVLAVQCGDDCYPHYFNQHLYGLIMVASALILYCIGFALSFIAYKRGNGNISGCHVSIIILIEILLLFTLVLCIWNMYDLVTNIISNDYPKIYLVMVFLNIVWNICLMILTVNILKKQDGDIIKKDTKNGSFTQLSRIDQNDDEIDDLSDQELFEQTISKKPVKKSKYQKNNNNNSSDEEEDDDAWRQGLDSPKINAYESWTMSTDDNNNTNNNDEENLKSKKKKKKWKYNNHKNDGNKANDNNNDNNNNVSAYGSGYNKSGYNTNTNKKVNNPFGSGSNDNLKRYDQSTNNDGIGGTTSSNNAWGDDNANNAWS